MKRFEIAVSTLHGKALAIKLAEAEGWSGLREYSVFGFSEQIVIVCYDTEEEMREQEKGR